MFLIEKVRIDSSGGLKTSNLLTSWGRAQDELNFSQRQLQEKESLHEICQSTISFVTTSEARGSILELKLKILYFKR